MLEINSFDVDTYKKIDNIICTESNVYYDNKYFYKLYKNTKKHILERKELKINMLDGYTLDNVILPKGKIKINKKFKGLFTDYIKKSYPLYNFKYVNNNIIDFLNIVKNSSITLRNIHESEIIVSDLSFDNIIFDSNGNHYFIDFDSCSLNNVASDRIPFLTSDYLNFRNCDYEIDYNFDRLSIILCTYFSLFEKEIQDVNEKEYDALSEKIKTLKNMKFLFVELKKRYKELPELPYIDEFIEKEQYTFTRYFI